MVLKHKQQQLCIQGEHFIIKEAEKTILQGFVTPVLALQLLELSENPEISSNGKEMMMEAIWLTALGNKQFQNKKNKLSFEEGRAVYLIVQGWKRSATIIEGEPSQWKPANMTTFRFSQIIRKLYNCSFSNLIRTINMQKAMKMLITEEHSITAVSEFSGYAQEENFISAFKKNYGITPGQLRKQIRQRTSFS